MMTDMVIGINQSESKQLFNSKVGMSTFNNAFEQEKEKLKEKSNT